MDGTRQRKFTDKKEKVKALLGMLARVLRGSLGEGGSSEWRTLC